MSRHFTCPQGHQWELASTASSLSAHLDPVCPVCGAPAQATTPDLAGKSDTGSVRLALGPAPVESTARVPAPLPVRQATVSAPPAPKPRPTEVVAAQKTVPTLRPSPPRIEPDEPSPAPTSWLRHPGVIAIATVLCMLPIIIVTGFVVPRGRIAEVRRRAEDARHQAQQVEERAAHLVRNEAAAKSQALAQARQAEQARDEALEQRAQARQDAERADKATRDVDRRRQEQADLREQALVAAKLAEQARDEALKARGEAEGRLAQLYSGQGVRSMQRGDLLESLVWLSEALRLTQGDARREAPQRLRLALILRQCPRPVQAWLHEKSVTLATFSPDGRRVLTIAKDGKARLWDAATGKAIGEALAATGEITSAQFSRDGRRVATAGADSTARVWDATSAKPITPPLEHPGPILAFAFSADEKRLHVVARDTMTGGTAFQTWNAASGEAVGQPWEFGHAVQTAAFTPDGRLILTIGLDGRTYLTDLTGKNSTPVFEQGGTLRHIAFSDDGRFAATCGSDKTARVWNVSERTEIGPPLVHPEVVLHVALSPDGRHAATTCADRIVRVWNVSTGQRILALRQRTLPTNTVFSPDGRHLLTTDQDGAAQVWDIESGKEVVPALWHTGPILAGAAFSPAGDRVLTASDREARIWDLTAGEPLATASDQSSERIKYSPDGKRFVRISGDSAQLYAADTGKPIGDAIKHKYDISLTLTTFSGDGRRVLTIAQRPGQDSADVELRVWDTATGKPSGPSIELISLVERAALSPDGTRAATGTAAQKVHIWDCKTGKEIGLALDLRQPISHLLFSPDGSKLVTATALGEVRVSDPTNGDPLAPPLKHREALTYLAITPDSKNLITASLDGVAQVTEATSGQAVAGPFRHGVAIMHVVLSADGGRAATAGADGTVQVWDTKTGQSAAPILHHDNPVSQIAFSPDGRWLATATGDRIRLWETATGEPVGGDLRPWSGGAAVTKLTFAKDGELVAAHGQPNDPRNLHVLDVRADSRSTAELGQLAVLMTGHRLNGAGALVAGDSDEMQKSWEALRAKNQQDFTQDPARLLAWHRRGAEECEQTKQWPGVLLHSERLAELEPKRWEHRARRARTFAALGRWQDAAGEYRKALEIDPDRGELLAGIAKAEMELKMWPSALEWLNRAVRVMPDDRDLWALRGRAFAESDKLKEAAEDYDKALRLGLNDAAAWYERTLLRLALGDSAGYPKACLQMRRRLGAAEDPRTLALLGWTCALAPDALPDLKPPLQRLEQSTKKDATTSLYLRAVGGLLYRMGQFAPAAQRLEEAAKQHAGKLGPIETVLLAMAYHRLGRAEDAKKQLENAAKDHDPAVEALPWSERLALKTLRREAEKLIADTKP
jgi:WD40 repeat protein/Flp pilus assembly protein TadD